MTIEPVGDMACPEVAPEVLTVLRAAEDTSLAATDSMGCHWPCVLVTFLVRVTKPMTEAINRRKDLFQI